MNFPVLVLSLLFCSAIASAQAPDTSRIRRTSGQRISVGKGEIVGNRVDTVYVTRYDTVRMSSTIVRVDTVSVVLATPAIWGQGIVHIDVRDSSALPVRRDSVILGATVLRFAHRYLTSHQYEVLDRSGIPLCRKRVEITSRYQEVCLVCDPVKKQFKEARCPR
jgi:hypothetical protein